VSTSGTGLLETILEELQEIRTRVDALGAPAAAPTAAPAPTATPVAAAAEPGSTGPLPGPALTPELRADIDRVLEGIPVDFGGGSGHAKAYAFASLVVGQGVRRAVEIGVYRGRSLLPLATALRATGGSAIGIDPYMADEALQFDDHAGGTDSARDWARETDWTAIHNSVLRNAAAFRVEPQIELWRMTSEEAADRIDPGSVDLVHVDGNHDAAAVERDVELYLPKLGAGGFIALDDASWPSIRPTARRLEDQLERVFELHDTQAQLYDAGGSDFAVYRVPA
jgi:predicted O-methyltransferase YrrM